jgi:hypothetical protein
MVYYGWCRLVMMVAPSIHLPLATGCLEATSEPLPVRSCCHAGLHGAGAFDTRVVASHVPLSRLSAQHRSMYVQATGRPRA